MASRFKAFRTTPFLLFLLNLKNRFQRKIWIEMIGSEPVAIEECGLIFLTRVAKNRNDRLTRTRFFGEPNGACNIDAAR